MRVKVDAIRDKGLELVEPLARPLVEEALSAVLGLEVVESGTLSVRFEKVGTDVLVKASFDCALEVPCKRCAEAVALPLKGSFALALVPDAKLGAAVDDEGEDDGGSLRAGTFALEDADQEPFDGRVIELDPIVREQLLLAVPVSVVCKDDCKGLCTVCGQNLNEAECGCDRHPVDVRLLKLKDIKLQ